MIQLAKWLYLGTPIKLLRRVYFYLFCLIVRRKKVNAAVNGIRYSLDLGEMIDVCLLLGRYEPVMTSAIKAFCKPGFRVLDIGANVGAHSLLMASIVGSSGEVHAFEPTDYAFGKLEKNKSLNNLNSLFLHKLALSDENLENQPISYKSSWPTFGVAENVVSKVDFICLDDWVEINSVGKIDLIKLDVDGNEFRVLNGAKGILKKFRPLILMEVWGPNFAKHDQNPFFLLDQLGYKFFEIDSGKPVDLAAMRERVSSNGQLMDYSFDILAK